MSDTNQIELTVIIPCRNARRWLPVQLEALAQERYDKPWEVLLVDNCSTDGSHLEAERFKDRLNIRVVMASDRPNLSYTKNTGAKAALGQKLLFTDADDQIAPGYVAAMARALEHYTFVSSQTDATSLNEPWADRAYSCGIDQEFILHPVAGGPNMGIRRDAFFKVGGFPEEYPTAEDFAFSLRARRLGIGIHGVEDAVLRYRYRKTPWRIYRQWHRWGLTLPLVYKEFGDLGMPKRTLARALRDWKDTLVSILKIRSKGDAAEAAARLGYCTGRLEGSLRYKTWYP